MAKKGRKSKYDSHVLPYLEQIPGWRRTMTERQICEKLGLGKTALYKYKAQHPELKKALEQGVELLVSDLQSALIKRAKGYEWTEVQILRSEDADGNVAVSTRTTNKHVPPDLGSIHLLLKNYDPEWRNDDATTLDLKRKELELKERRAYADDW